MKNISKIITASLCGFLMVSCAEKNVNLPKDYWKKKHKVAVVRSSEITADLSPKGMIGLLDYAIIRAANQKMTKQLNSADLNWYKKFPNTLADRLRNAHANAVVANTSYSQDDLNKNKSLISHKLNSDELLVVKLNGFGVTRNYYGFLPLSAPMVYCSLTGELINVKTDEVLWRYNSYQALPVSGVWDQPPAYPNITKSIKLVTKQASSNLLRVLFASNGKA